MSVSDQRSQTRHDLKKSLRRLKLIFDELESESESLSSEELKSREEDFENDLEQITALWKIYKETKLND